MRSPTVVTRRNVEIGRNVMHRLAQVDCPGWQLGGESRSQRKRATNDAIRGYINRIARIAVNAGGVINECVTESILLEYLDSTSLGH
jgi:hypothetical protein